MRHRVAVHLLLVVVYAAVFGTALATPSELTASVVAFVAWVVYATLAWWAYAHPKNRFTICSALIFGVSYIAMAMYYPRFLLPSLVSERILTRLTGDPVNGDRLSILEIEWSFLFALMGGALGAYWSRSQSKE